MRGLQLPGAGADETGVAARPELTRPAYHLPTAVLPPWIRRAFVLIVVATALFMVTTLTRQGLLASTWLSVGLYQLVVFASSAVVVARGLLVRAERSAWLVLAAAVCCYAIGDASYSIAAAVTSVPYPSVADAFYLAFYPPAYVGLILLLRSRLRRMPVAMWMDGAVAGLTLAAATSAVAFGPISATTGGTSLEIAVGLAYPLGDLLLLAVAVASQAALGWQPDRRRALLVTSFTIFGVADTVYLLQAAEGTYVEGTPLDVLWVVAISLIAFASWQPARQLSDHRLEGWTVIAPPSSASQWPWPSWWQPPSSTSPASRWSSPC